MQDAAFRTRQLEPYDLPGQARGSWILIRTEGWGRNAVRHVFVDVLLGAGQRMGQRVHLVRRRSGRFEGVLFTPPDACRLTFGVIGRQTPDTEAARVSCRPIGPVQAFSRLFWRAPRSLPKLFSDGIPSGRDALRNRLIEVVRPILANTPITTDYAIWRGAFADWSHEDLPDDPAAPAIAVLLFDTDPSARRAALEASKSAIARQNRPVPLVTVQPGESWRAAVDTLGLGAADHVALLQAGEVPVPYAFALARLLLRDEGNPGLATADEDRLDAHGLRVEPMFKPRPNHALMLSGTLASGLWLVRRDVLDACGPADDDDAACHAESFRLSLWLRMRRAGRSESAHLPHVLVSRRTDAQAAPRASLAAVVGDHLAQSRLPFGLRDGWPIRLRPVAAPVAVPVTAVVPSTLRAPHAEGCIAAILQKTAYGPFDMVIAVSQSGPLDEVQSATARRLTDAFPNVEIRLLPSATFNFSWTVNQLTRGLRRGRLALLLNDDVSPTDADWLTAMSAHLADPAVGAVGAKLLYPSGRIQHAGVVMGLAGLCEHAFRHEPGDTQGYGHRAVLSQRLSAVTGACLLVRTDVMHDIGHMDESYPSAFNDVDLCLRIGEAGWEVVYAAEACLVHHELQTYGDHYSGERAQFMETEIARMRARWPRVVADDPYYNPNLDLRSEHAFTLAVPPRIAPPRAAMPFGNRS